MKGKKSGFEPQVIVFSCNWGSFSGTDFSEIGGFRFPKKVRMVKVKCANEVDADVALETLKEGADGFLLIGCNPGDCHYQLNNKVCMCRMELAEKLLDLVGLEKKRVTLGWASAEEEKKLGEIVDEFIERVKKLGPNPASNDEVLREKLSAAAVASISPRAKGCARKKIELVASGNIYGETFTVRQFDLILDPVLEQEYKRARIMLLAKDGAKVQEIARKTGLEDSDVMLQITALRQEGKIVMGKVEDDGHPIFRSVM